MVWESLKKNYHAKNFYSLLAGKKLSNKGYEHILKAWDKFETKTTKNYCGSSDNVLLLTDMFEKFRNGSLKIYRLCFSHYLSITALSLNVMLKWNSNLFHMLKCICSLRKV